MEGYGWIWPANWCKIAESTIELNPFLVPGLWGGRFKCVSIILGEMLTIIVWELHRSLCEGYGYREKWTFSIKLMETTTDRMWVRKRDLFLWQMNTFGWIQALSSINTESHPNSLESWMKSLDDTQKVTKDLEEQSKCIEGQQKLEKIEEK